MPKRKLTVDLLLDAKADLAEGPVWDPERGCLSWVDIVGKRVHFLSLHDGSDTFIQLDVMVGCASPIPGTNQMMLATENGFGYLDRDTEVIRWLGDPESDLPENRFNDGKFDSQGRFWAGTMRKDGGGQKAGKLYRFDRDGKITTMIHDVGLSNGLAWHNDKMFYVDTSTRNVDVFDFDEEEGTLSGGRTAIELSDEDGFPDGLCVDEDGTLWLAQWGAGRVGHYDWTSGRLIEVVHVPAPHVSSICMVGSKRFVITTAREGLDNSQLAQYPLSGGLFQFQL